MLIILSTFSLGGIETFFVRLAKERFKNGLKTKFLLFYRKKNVHNQQLLSEAQKYADVIFFPDIIGIPKALDRLSIYNLFLLFPYYRDKLKSLFCDVKHVHVTGGHPAHFVLRIMRISRCYIPLTVATYHPETFCWEGGGNIPFFEKKNRELVFDHLDRKNFIMPFGDYTNHFKKSIGVSMEAARCFPIGVINKKNDAIPKRNFGLGSVNSPLRICSVGRLVDFKTYNLWMQDVIADLISDNIFVEYHIYGDGNLYSEIEDKIKEKNLFNHIFLHGNLEYSKFSDTVQCFDIFIGMGTAIVEAASLGVPSINCFPFSKDPVTSGFVSDALILTYSEEGKCQKLMVYDVISSFLKLSEKQKQDISVKHIKKVNVFSIEECSKSFERVGLEATVTKEGLSTTGWLIYMASFFFTLVRAKIFYKGSMDNLMHKSK